MDPKAAIRTALCGFVAALPLLITDPFAHAEDVARGRRLAQMLCSQCHFITADQKGWFDAPSFAAIANNPATTLTSLEVIIESPHPKMAPRAPRGPSDAADLSAYIRSLKR